jgi:cation diffusion facilitator CzcD-associated flavoprotein CzcO
MRGWYRRWRRFRQALIYENVWDANREGTKRNLQAQRLAEEYIETVFKDRPDLQKIVTPAYPFGGKRTMKDSNFYPALLRDNVELIPHAVTHVTPNCVVDETGCEREVDVLVMCTGFQPTNFLATIDIIGRDGVSIHEAWKGEPQGYLGINVTGFPNFYMLYGPNTNGVPLMWMHERQSEFIAANLKRMMKSGVTSIEPKESFMNAFNRYTQKRLARDVSALHPEVHNYGITESRRNVISWPEGLVKYSFLTHMTPRISSIDRRKSK